MPNFMQICAKLRPCIRNIEQTDVFDFVYIYKMPDIVDAKSAAC